MRAVRLWTQVNGLMLDSRALPHRLDMADATCGVEVAERKRGDRQTGDVEWKERTKRCIQRRRYAALCCAVLYDAYPKPQTQ